MPNRRDKHSTRAASRVAEAGEVGTRDRPPKESALTSMGTERRTLRVMLVAPV